mgnify:CR=1 FL=1
MLTKGDWTAALSIEKRMYLALSEVLETTESMLDAVKRQDQVSIRMYLNLRQDQVNQLRGYKELLQKQCRTLPDADGEVLRRALSGGPAGEPEGEALCQQVSRNRSLLERTIQMDQTLSRQLGGKHSFYQR